MGNTAASKKDGNSGKDYDIKVLALYTKWSLLLLLVSRSCAGVFDTS